MMDRYLLIAVVVLAAGNLALLIAYFRRRATVDPESLRGSFDALAAESRRVEGSLRDELSRQRGESARDAQGLREEVIRRIGEGHETLLSRQSAAQQAVEQKVEGFRATLETRLREFGDSSDSRLARLRQELNDGTEKIRLSVEAKLSEIQARNEVKLEEMRKTVDEKLEGTLERRFNESFARVSERLEQVHKGLGEMSVMANSVGDLKRVLTNVKTRGTWGEIQLGALLEQILTPGQYQRNVATRPNSNERVEYAICLPGKGDDERPVWLPIDAKFPQEDYQRLIEAAEACDSEGVAAASKALDARLRSQAKDIRDKYISPPSTTDFALLFLPSEGLYAEALRRPGLWDRLQRESRVVLAGPSTLAALLNSLQMGFKTLAIQQHSSQVWKVLAGVKDEFGKFGDVLVKVKKKLDEASSQIEQTQVRSRAIDRQLRGMEALSDGNEIPQTESLALAESGCEEQAADEPFFERGPSIDK